MPPLCIRHCAPKLDRYQLFDLKKDPDEITDRTDDPAYADAKERLTRTLAQQRRQLGDGLLK